MVFVLLIIYQIKHFVADFPLQNEYMLGKFKEKGWVLPLAAHAGVHAVLTFIISFLFVAQKDIFHNGTFHNPLLIVFVASTILATFDFVVHFIMDRIKASPKMLGRYKAITKEQYIEGVTEEQLDSNKKFWYSLGLDQTVHHLTHYVIIWSLV